MPASWPSWPPASTGREGASAVHPWRNSVIIGVEASVRTSGRQSCVASASKTQICRTARRPRGARASSRARCAGRASDLFFVRPNAPGDDLPSPHASGREAGRDKPWRGPSPSSSSCRRRVGIACGMRCDCTARAPRSRSRCSRRPHRSRAGAPRPDAPVPNNACPPPRGRAPSDGSAARRNRLPASRARVALRVSGTSRCLLDVRSGLWPSGLHLHSAHSTLHACVRLQAREVPQWVLPAQSDRATGLPLDLFLTEMVRD